MKPTSLQPSTDLPHATPVTQPVVFFDGVCGLCNRAVDFLLRADRHQVLRFAPLQGETAAALLGRQTDAPLDSIVLLDASGRHERSYAILLILQHLGGAWRMAGLLTVVPRPLRDAFYLWIARNRYAWFGQKATCRIPNSADRARFLA